ncbi:hypothetical protein ABC418_17220 [Lactiplantibacillus plantarum]|uniref:hypothetical protein n=1 Tax=Lactiplantibacillus plantarum TaxID=1590 RepID=UPI003965A27E
MSLNVEVINSIKELYNQADKGQHTYYLDNFDQQDVADSVNALHATKPEVFLESDVDYTGKADITFVKR